MTRVLALSVLVTLSAGAGAQALLNAVRRGQVRSIASLCDVMLGRLGPDDVASVHARDHADFFRVVKSILPRLDGTDEPGKAAAFDALEDFAGRHGSARKDFVELMAGLSQVSLLSEATLAQLNGSSAANVRARLARAFVTQPEIIGYIRERHDRLDVHTRTHFHNWLGRAFEAEVNRRRKDPGHAGLGPRLYSSATAAQLSLARGVLVGDQRLLTTIHNRLGGEILAMFGVDAPEGY